MRKIISFMGISRRLGLTILSLLACISFCVTPSFAAPYGPDGKAVLYRQPDGSTVKVRVFGDEFYAVDETEEGYTVVYDKHKVLTYGILSADGKQIVSTGIRASNKPDHATLQASGIKKNIRLSPQGRKEAVAKGLQRMRADRKGRVTPKSVQYYSEALAASAAQFASSADSELPPPPPSYAPPTETRTGVYIGLCLLVDFSDQVGTIPRSALDDYCNKPGYTGYSNAGSIYDYFFIQSGGRLQYNNIVTAYVRVPNPKTYYDDGSNLPWGSSKAQQLVIDALDVLMAQGFDFTQLSRDGSGNIYSINVFYAGTCASPRPTGLWPSSWAIPAKTVDAANGIKAYSYQMTDMGTSLEIGTFCHENGHMLMDYPDLYSYDGNAANIGNYSLMANGNSAGGGLHPANIDPYLKTASGWADIVDLSSNSNQRCTVQVDANLFYRYRNPSKATEYFIFEVRDDTGYEGLYGGASGSVNPGAGLVAYHVLEEGLNTESSIFTVSNPTCSYTTPYELLLVEANPNGTKTPWYDDPTPDTNDAFKASGKSYLSDTTTPNLKFWDATGRNTASGCFITNVSADGSSMTFVVGAGALTNAPSIVLSRTTIDSFCDFGDTAVSKTFSIGNGGGGTLSYTLSTNQSWLSCTPTSGTASNESDTITVSYATSNLVAGIYSATITVTDPAASPTSDTIAVNLTVNPQPSLSLSTTNIVESGIAGMMGPPFPVYINNTGGGAMTYSLSKTQSWLTLSPTSGTVIAETDTVYANLNATTLVPGTYNDTITITSPEVSNSPQTIAVTFSVNGDDIVVTAPNGGEQFFTGNQMDITWLSSIGGNVSIALLKNGFLDTAITSSTTNDGSHSWTIPDTKKGADYKIRVTSLDASPGFADDSSGSFSIQRPPLVNEDFEASTNRPAGWSEVQIVSTATWKIQKGGEASGGSNPSTAHSGTNNATLYYANTSDHKTRLITSTFDATGFTNLVLNFWHTQAFWSPDQDFLNVFFSTNGGSSWVWMAGYSNSLTSWTERNLSLLGSGTNCKVAFEGNAKYGYGVCIDDVMVTGDSSGPSIIVTKSGGSVDVTEGGATDAYTVVLGVAPSASVSITITPDAEVSVNATNLTFTTGNWASTQTVTVTAVNDVDHELNHIGTITHAVSSTDPAFNGIAIDDVLVSITDNDNNAPTVYAGSDQTVFMTGSVWSPAEENLSLWLDADDAGTVLLNGSTVSNWVDKSGGGRHATQTTTASQPADTAGGLNGKHVVRFDGASDYLNVNLDFLAGVSHSAFIVTKPTAYTDIYGAANASAGANSLHVGFASSTTYRMNYWGNDLSGTVSANFHAGAGNILNYVWTTGAAKAIFANGSAEGTSGALAGAIGTMAGGGRLSNVVGHGYFGGDIAEIIMVTGTVSVATRETFEGYLAHKWGAAAYLPSAHPYKSESPNNAAASANIDGTVNDADSDPLTTVWTKFSGPGPVTFDDPNIADTVAHFSVDGVYTLRLTESDGYAQVSDDVVITVNPAGSGFAVVYTGNGSTGGSPPVDGTYYSTNATVTVLENTNGLIKTGYTFGGWNTAANGSGSFYAPAATFTINSNTTLYAQWTANTYTVTLNRQSGTGGSSSVVATYGSTMPVATAPTRVGYTFGGYYTAVDGGGTQYYTAPMASARSWDLTANTTLYAKWTLIPVSVITDLDAVNVPEGGTNTFQIKLSIQPSSNMTVTVFRTAGDADITVQSGGTRTFTTSDWDTYQTVPLTAANDGDTANGSATITCDASDPAYTDKNVTANETDKHTTLTVSNDGNGATVPSGAVIVEKSAATGIAATANEGYNFANWSVTNGVATIAATNSVSTTAAINAPASVRANFTIKTYTVSYSGNGNTGGAAPSSQIKTHGVNLILATNSGSLTNTGYSFSGWNTAADGNGASYAAGGTYSTDAAVTLYAKWTILPPAAPASLVATAFVGRVELSWNPSATAGSYNIKRSSTSGSGYATIGNTNSTSFSDTTVAQGVTYYYVVSAVNAGGESSYSSEVSATLPFVLPFADNFEASTVGPLHGQNGWEALNANVQTNAAIGTNAVSIDADDGYVKHVFSGSDTNVWTDIRIQPVFAPEPMVPSATGCTSVVYFNTNGHPVVYDGTNRVVLIDTTVSTGSWIRITVRSDYVAKTWDLYINNTEAATGLGFYNEAVNRYECLAVKGGSALNGVELDEICIGSASPFGEPLSFTVISDHGTPSPTGTIYRISSSVIDAWISDTSITNGLTNYVCTGWTRTGSAPASGAETNMSFTLTNDTTITWQWETNYYITFSVTGDIFTSGAGSVDVATGWYVKGTNLSANATPHEHSVFDRWTGNTNGTAINSTTNPLIFEVKAPSSITAVFRDRLTSSNSVPYWWLASVGITNDVEAAVSDDPDNDSFTTAQEYWSGTDPTNSESLLQIDQILVTSTNVRLVWAHARVDAAIPPISIQTRASLITGEWINASQNMPVNGTNMWNSLTPVGDFFRLCVTNMP